MFCAKGPYLESAVAPSALCPFQGLDEEALVDHGKTSFATLTNYEKDELESKFNFVKSC